MRPLYIISLILAIIGGLNWGLVGLFNLDLIAMFFGDMTLITKSVYIIIGAGSFALLFFAIPWETHSSDIHSHSGKSTR